MIYSKLGHCRLLALLVIVVCVIGAGRCPAQESRTFVIAATSGYGVEECLDAGDECGRLVADAWCTAQGQGIATKFGRSEIDGPASANASSWPAPERYYVACAPTEAR
jgi:hypothetical protein